MRPRVNELVAGFFMIAMVGAFMLFLSFMSDAFKWPTPKREAVAYFRSIGAMKKNCPVTYQGVSMGTVSGIELADEPELKGKGVLIRVRMKIEESWELPEKAIATIAQGSILGDYFVEITSQYAEVGKDRLILGDDRVRKDKDPVIFDAVDPMSLTTVLTEASNVLGKTGHLMDQGSSIMTDVEALTKDFDSYGDTVGNILEGADRTMDGAEKLVANPQFREDIHLAATHARGAMGSARNALDKVDGIVERSSDTIQRIVDNADELVMNARVLTYSLAESPWRIVWKDNEWKKRVDSRDSGVIYASLRKPSEATATTDGDANKMESAFKPDRGKVPRTGYQ